MADMPGLGVSLEELAFRAQVPLPRLRRQLEGESALSFREAARIADELGWPLDRLRLYLEAFRRNG